MTREEAILRLERERDFSRKMEKSWSQVDWKDRPDHLADPRELSENHRMYADALDMAISALREQETVTGSHQLETVTKCHDLYDEDGGEIINRVEFHAVKEEPCEWCFHFASDRQYLVSQGNGMYKEAMFEFCPMCGRRLEEV